MRIAILMAALMTAACGSDGVRGSDAGADASAMCVDTNGVGGSCTMPGAVAIGTCFESPRCVCVFPEAVWVCCYAGYAYEDPQDPPKHAGDPCCGIHAPYPGQPGYPCYCDETHHWSCPVDLGTRD